MVFPLVAACGRIPSGGRDSSAKGGALPADDGSGCASGTRWCLDQDLDGDGWPASQDCDDVDPAVHPGATEWCNGRDDDCDDATTDDGVATWTPAGGPRQDWTAALAGSPAVVTIDAPGQLDLCAATWSLNLDLQADVAVVGHDAVVDGADSSAVVAITSADLAVEIRGVQLQGGAGVDWEYGRVGGGVACLGPGTTLSIVDSIVQANGTPTFGGGIYASGCDVQLTDTQVRYNLAEYGAGMFLTDSRLIATGLSLVQNFADDRPGGGMYLYALDRDIQASISDSTVTGNVAADGGGLYLRAGGRSLLVDLDGVEVANNNAPDGGGGGVYVITGESATVTATITDSAIHDNMAEWGGGLALLGYQGTEGAPELALVDTTISDNEATDGAGIHTSTTSHLLCSDSGEGHGAVLRNQARNRGGGFFEEGPDWDSVHGERLRSEGCDWGSGDDSNSPVDVLACDTSPDTEGVEHSCDYLAYDWTTESFRCLDGLCETL